VGSALSGVGVGLGGADGDGVATGESPGDVVGCRLDAGVPVAVDVQLVRTTASVAAKG